GRCLVKTELGLLCEMGPKEQQPVNHYLESSQLDLKVPAAPSQYDAPRQSDSDIICRSRGNAWSRRTWSIQSSRPAPHDRGYVRIAAHRRNHQGEANRGHLAQPSIVPWDGEHSVE